MTAKREKRNTTSDDFIRKWWTKRFLYADPPTWNSVITCADASDLLDKFRRYLRRVSR